MTFTEDGFLAETNNGDGKRHQGEFGKDAPVAKHLRPIIEANLSRVEPDDHVFFLGRKKDCDEQPWHRDAKHGAFMVCALTDNYTLRVLRGSHLATKNGAELT